MLDVARRFGFNHRGPMVCRFSGDDIRFDLLLERLTTRVAKNHIAATTATRQKQPNPMATFVPVVSLYDGSDMT